MTTPTDHGNYPSGQPYSPPPPWTTPPPTEPKKRKHSRFFWPAWAIVVAIATILGVVIATALGGDGGGSVATNPAVTVAPNPMPPISSDQAAANSSAASEPPADTSNNTAKIGETLTYEDGIAVTVVSVKRTSFSDVSYGARGTGVAVVVKITNGGAETLDLAMSDVELTYGADGQQSEQVFDLEKGFEGGFDTKLAHGRTATAKYGFAVPRGVSAVSVQVTPDFSSETAIFEGSAS